MLNIINTDNYLANVIDELNYCYYFCIIKMNLIIKIIFNFVKIVIKNDNGKNY